MTPRRPGSSVHCPEDASMSPNVHRRGVTGGSSMPAAATFSFDDDDHERARTSSSECSDEFDTAHYLLRKRDPPSSTSPSSFLQPGIIWTGQQIFVPKLHHHYHPESMPAHLAIASGDNTSSSSRRDTVISAIERLIAARSALERSATHLDSAHDTSTSLVGHLRSSPYTNAISQDRERQELLARLRIRIERELSNSRSLLDRASATLPPPPPPAQQLVKDEDKKECWSVQVMIQSVDPRTRDVTGLMHALGLSPFGAKVTTYFTGTVIDPAHGLWSRKYGLRKREDAEYWCKIGPFARYNVTKEDLKDRGHDESWLAELSRGWILMRWKEREFVNVIPPDSTLSIAGYYLIALDRSTGAIEGLYYDPVSSPFQKLTLSVETERAPFKLGTFDLQ